MSHRPQGGAPPNTAPKLRPPTNQIRSFDDLDAWCRGAGIPLVPLSPSLHLEQLVAADVPAWIAIDNWASDEREEAFGLKHATRVIRADDLDPVCAEAASLAVQGERVLLLEEPGAAPFLTGDAGRDSVK